MLETQCLFSLVVFQREIVFYRHTLFHDFGVVSILVYKGKINFSISQTFCKLFFVAREGFEPPTSRLWAWRATSAAISRYIFHSKNFQIKSHKVKTIFSNNQTSVGHFFLRLSSHLVYKVKTKFSFCQIYFINLSKFGDVVLSDVSL